MPKSPQKQSGWEYLNSIQANRKVRIGALSLAAAATLHATGIGEGALEVYGKLQGKGADHFVEQELTQVAAADTEIDSHENPQHATMSGVVIPDQDTEVCFGNEIPSPASTLDVGLSDADGEGDNDAIFDGLVPEAGKCFTMFGSGAIKSPSRITVSPRESTGSASHVTFRWKTGSGQTQSGDPSGFARVRVRQGSINVDL